MHIPNRNHQQSHLNMENKEMSSFEIYHSRSMFFHKVFLKSDHRNLIIT